MKCHSCGHLMLSTDTNCRRCAAAVQSPPLQWNVTQSRPSFSSIVSGGGYLPWIISGMLGVILLVVMMGNAITSAPTPSDAPQAPPATLQEGLPPAPIAPIQALTVRVGPSFNEVDSKMDDRLTSWTEAQRQAYWQSVSGSQVTWRGEVQEIAITSGGTVNLRCNPKSWGTDVYVTLDGSQIDKLASINKNQFVTITGILNSHGMTGYNISQGHINGL